MSNSSENNKRIAKNTVLLYIRTIVIMVINLYASRIVLRTLGVEDYGVYNAVGGVIAMFSVISGALSAAISRFITFELGKGRIDRINMVFSTSVNILVIISIIILILAEPIGVWFLNTKMQIPPDRMIAANWVFQCALFSFCINVLAVPYNSAIIAHEKMSVYAYISIFEAIAKLGVVYLLVVLMLDKLIVYSILLAIVALILFLLYYAYCRSHFKECHYHFSFDKPLTKEMIGFAGWSFLTSTTYVFNTQGINILSNLFFGVTINAARGIATQVDGAVMQFVNNFTMALNPQITKNYAQGNNDGCFRLVCKGTKFSYFLMLLFAIPLIAETDFVLHIWLGETVPEYASLFIKLGLIAIVIDRIGVTITTACMATGNIKAYTIFVSLSASLAFLLSWLFFKLGMSPESAYYAFIISYFVVNVTRLVMMKKLCGFSIRVFIKEVVIRIGLTTIIALIVPVTILLSLPSSFLRFFVILIFSTISTLLCSFFVGMTGSERGVVINYIKIKLSHVKPIQ